MIHLVLIAIAMQPVVEPQVVGELPATIDVSIVPMMPIVEPQQHEEDDDSGGGRAGVGMKLDEPRAPSAATLGARVRDTGWEATTLGYDGGGDGTGTGDGLGNGTGHGIGDGFGNGVGHGMSLRDVPAPPPAHVSKARPAKLLHPTREMEVEAEELFAAVVTVDPTGDVVGAQITKSHPGVRADTASSMIWQFRYAPALDDDGNPTRSTFVQTFAVR